MASINSMLIKIARTCLLLFIFCCLFAQSAEAIRSQPFTLRLVAKPSIFVPGESQLVTVEIKNRLAVPLTLSSLYAFSWSVDWSNPDGSGQGAFSGSGRKTIIGTNIDPDTGEITCKYSHYEKRDFFIIPARASKRFDVL